MPPFLPCEVTVGGKEWRHAFSSRNITERTVSMEKREGHRGLEAILGTQSHRPIVTQEERKRGEPGGSRVSGRGALGESDGVCGRQGCRKRKDGLAGTACESARTTVFLLFMFPLQAHRDAAGQRMEPRKSCCGAGVAPAPVCLLRV